jgi:type II secretory pathway pseudopilin PulG
MTDARRTQAFTMIEMTVLLALVAIAMLMAAQLFTTCTNTLTKQREHLVRTGQIDSAIAQLRWDAWSSTACQTPEPGTLTLTRVEGGAITWRVDADTGQWSRSADVTRRWKHMAGVQLQAQERSLAVLVPDRAGLVLTIPIHCPNLTQEPQR